MPPPRSEIDSIKLSSSVTVAKYRQLETMEDRDAIADFIWERFEERYLLPIESMGKKNGFCIMAICCLLIEAITAFHEGWAGRIEQRRKPYRIFFARFATFGVNPEEQADALYQNVRNGVLHLGETLGGWRILRKGPLVDFVNRTVNATRFAAEMRLCLAQYCNQLRRETWNKRVWQRFRNRMNELIRNCDMNAG
jgi:hypothetical protein